MPCIAFISDVHTLHRSESRATTSKEHTSYSLVGHRHRRARTRPGNLNNRVDCSGGSARLYSRHSKRCDTRSTRVAARWDARTDR